MKKFISIILCLSMLIASAPAIMAAQGDTVPSVGADNGYHSESDMSSATESANTLYELGLFKGTGVGSDGSPTYELNRSGSRVEALVMLIRLLGKESEATGKSWTHPFNDVPAWANNYVGYAYQNGLTNGISATQFGTGTASAQMYLTFLIRALGYTDSDTSSSIWNEAMNISQKLGLFSTDDDSYELCTDDFWRADMAVLSCRALSAETKSGVSLSEKLSNDGVFDAKQAQSLPSPAAKSSSDDSLTENPAENTSSIVITEYKRTYHRNENATISIHAKPLTAYKLSVYYKSKSTASGLGEFVTDENGNLSWNFKIGGNTTEDTQFYFIITGNDESTGKIYFTVAD